MSLMGRPGSHIGDTYVNENTVFIGIIATGGIKEWLEEHCKDNYTISMHAERTRFAGPSVPLEECMEYTCQKIIFKNEEDKLMFLIAWGDKV